MPWYGKGFNDGPNEPTFRSVGEEPIDFIPVGKEDEYYQDVQGNWWPKKDKKN